MNITAKNGGTKTKVPNIKSGIVKPSSLVDAPKTYNFQGAARHRRGAVSSDQIIMFKLAEFPAPGIEPVHF